MKIKAMFLLMAIGLAAPLVNAADYYVSSIRSGRSDSNAGTNPDAPWATFGKVISSWGNLSPGDTVHVERGSRWDLSFSSDYFNVNNGGSAAGGPITLRGDDYGTGGRPILRRTGGSGDNAFIVIQRSYVTVRDLELDGGNSDYGKNTAGMLILADGRDVSNAQILNMKIHNLGGSTTAYVCGIWLASWTQNTTSDCLIEGNEVSDYAGHGLNHYSQGRMNRIIWRNNYVHNSYTGGRFPSANAALQITSGGQDCIFEHNWLEDTTSTEGCILGFGKYSGDTGVNTIRFNVITGANTYGALFTVDYSNMKLNYDIYGNIFMNNARSGFALHPYNSYAAGTTFNFYNNTFYNNGTGGDSSRSEMEIDSQCVNTTISFANNLIVHRNSSSGGLVVKSGFNGNFSHRNNLFWHEGGTAKTIISHGSNYTVANAKNYEPTAQNNNPLFKNTAQLPTSVSFVTGPVPDGLSLQASSPALGAGADLGSTYALDITRTVRTPPWSIGAYQTSATPPPADTTPPTVSMTVPSSGATVSGNTTVSATASDNTGVAGVQFMLDGADLGAEDTAAPFSVAWDTTGVANGLHTLTAVARDAAGNTTASTAVDVTVENVSLPVDSIISQANAWQNLSFPAETTLFVIAFEAIPQAASIDCVTGVSLGSASDYDQLAAIVRFNSNGQIDVRNGDVYTADAAINYSIGTSYKFRMVIDIPLHEYNVYVQVDGEPEILIAHDYAFRTSQNAVTSLNTLAVTAAAGSHIVFNFAENSIHVDIPEPPPGLRVRLKT